ncbi:hypothetical protein RchiOBHm_Chr1g0374171 [Rosa chinensis]|uniref:Uncharacterized protein n=1 Tax=Rosa chinensis TaxID=74649 RepID=A0A2P6SMB2_ROSCH|nr:hypothetical protein RchiOBHm_Chr1g0374171 [Rosa chinensis]
MLKEKTKLITIFIMAAALHACLSMMKSAMLVASWYKACHTSLHTLKYLCLYTQVPIYTLKYLLHDIDIYTMTHTMTHTT